MAFSRLALLSGLAVCLAACKGGGVPAAKSATQAAPAATGVGVVAEVDGAPIMASELEQRAASRLARLRQEEFDIRSQALDELIGERLLAAEAERRKTSLEDLLKREVETKAQRLSPAELEQVYEQNKARFGDLPKPEALARISEVLGERGVAERRAAFTKELRAKARVAVRLEPPRAGVQVPAGAPYSGPQGAPVTIVEFTDYQCPYCHRAQATIDELVRRYPEKVRLVHLDFPLEGHPGAVPAARAARCAGEQNRFWDYHRDLMTRPGILDKADLEGRAARLGLKADAFASCVASPRHDEAIRADFAQGESLGVTGTPAYFVNGRMLSGARPVEDFAAVIDAELAR
jgi:protein-disulfide isomerase